MIRAETCTERNGLMRLERRALLALVVSLVVLLTSTVLVGDAQAARGLTKAEKRGIARSIGWLPARCMYGKRSTIDKQYALARGKHRRGCPQGDGFVAVKRVRGGWKEVGQGSGGTCAEFARYIDMPKRIMRELGACS